MDKEKDKNKNTNKKNERVSLDESKENKEVRRRTLNEKY